MNQPPYSPSRPPAHLPVLTEVLEEKPLAAVSSVPVFPELPVLTPLPELPQLPEVDLSFPPPVPTPVVPSAAEALAEQLDKMAIRVRANVQLQVDQLLEARLREAMAPLLAQQADTLVFRLKMELAGMLDDMVARAVSQEIHRQSLE
jgi:hypothetical protein